MKCSVEECEDERHCKGLCNKHYQKKMKYGDPNTVVNKYYGYSRHPLYFVYKGMMRRCYDVFYKGYKDHGGRGIIVCGKWKNDIREFMSWALPIWKEGLYFDRRDNEGNYTPENCRFITPLESALNRRVRKNSLSGYHGVTFDRKSKKYVICMMKDGKKEILGYFSFSRSAAIAYDEIAIKLNDGRPRNFL